jgi:hypothetical protein
VAGVGYCFSPPQDGDLSGMAGCPSGQRERSVKSSAEAYVGSNPTPATDLKLASDRAICRLFMIGACLQAVVPRASIARRVRSSYPASDVVRTRDAHSCCCYSFRPHYDPDVPFAVWDIHFPETGEAVTPAGDDDCRRDWMSGTLIMSSGMACRIG